MFLFDILFFIGLLFLLQRFLYQRFWQKKLTMRLAFSRTEAVEGESLELKEEISNAKLLPLPFLGAKFRVSKFIDLSGEDSAIVTDDHYQNDIFSIAMYQHITRTLPFVCRKRGFYQIKSMEVTASDLFHSFTLTQHVPSDTQLTVLPRLLPWQSQDVLFRQLYGDITIRRFTNPDPFAFRGIREYLPGDSFASINFRATAQTGKWMTNMHDATVSQKVHILLNLYPYKERSRDQILEEAIRVAASAADYFTHLGITVALYTNGRDTITGEDMSIPAGAGPSHSHAIRRRLARVDLTKPAARFPTDPARFPGQDTAYLLISTYDGEDIQAFFHSLEHAAAAARWVIPILGLEETDVPAGPTIEHW